MIRVFLGLYFLITIERVIGQGIAFEDNGRRHLPVSFGSQNSNNPVRRRPYGNPSSIENILQIPIALIQGTSAAAQSWYPQNGESINKVFDIPVQTIQAVGTFVKDRYPNNQNNNGNQVNRREDRRDRLMKIREMELNRRKQIAEQQQQRLEQRLQLFQRQKQQNEVKIHSVGKRDDSMGRTFGVYGWASAFTDVLLDELGYGHGHGGLFSGHGGHFGGHGGHFGGHGSFLDGNKKKKKKKKKPIHGSHFGNHQNMWGGFGGGHGGHGSHGSHGSQAPSGISAGIQQFFGGGNQFYEVTEHIDEHVPQSFFSWQQSLKDSDKIQNKIAPRSNS